MFGGEVTSFGSLNAHVRFMNHHGGSDMFFSYGMLKAAALRKTIHTISTSFRRSPGPTRATARPVRARQWGTFTTH